MEFVKILSRKRIAMVGAGVSNTGLDSPLECGTGLSSANEGLEC